MEPTQCDIVPRRRDIMPRRRTSFRRYTLQGRDSLRNTKRVPRTAVKRSISIDSVKGRVLVKNTKKDKTFFDYLKKLVGKKNKPKKASSNLFGRPLEDLCHSDTEELPQTLLDIMHILAVSGPATTGVLRRVGKVATVNEVRARLEKGQTVDEAMEDLVDTQQVNVAAALLKSFLRELPDCLLQGELYDNWLALLDTDRKVATAKRLVSSLLPCHQNLLQHIICLMRRIAVSSDINLMTSSNLAVCLGPNLLWPSKTTSSPCTTMTVNRLVQLLIDNCMEIFDHDVFESTGNRDSNDAFLDPGDSHSGDVTTDRIVPYRCPDLVMEHHFSDKIDVKVNLLHTSGIVPSVDSLSLSSERGSINEDNVQMYHNNNREKSTEEEIAPTLLSCSMFKNSMDSIRSGDIFSFDTGYGSFTSSNKSGQLVPECDGQAASTAHCDHEGICCKSDDEILSEPYDSFLASTTDISVAGRGSLLSRMHLSSLSCSQCSSGIANMSLSTSSLNSQSNLGLYPLSPKHVDCPTHSSLPDLPCPSESEMKKSREGLPRVLSEGDIRTQRARPTPTGWGFPALIKPALKKVKNTFKSLAGTNSYSIENVASNATRSPVFTVEGDKEMVRLVTYNQSRHRQEDYVNTILRSYTGPETWV